MHILEPCCYTRQLPQYLPKNGSTVISHSGDVNMELLIGWLSRASDPGSEMIVATSESISFNGVQPFIAALNQRSPAKQGGMEHNNITNLSLIAQNARCIYVENAFDKYGYVSLIERNVSFQMIYVSSLSIADYHYGPVLVIGNLPQTRFSHASPSFFTIYTGLTPEINDIIKSVRSIIRIAQRNKS